MKNRSGRILALVAALALPVFALAAWAGEKGYKCTDDTQTCLNHMAANLKTRGWLGIEMNDEGGWKSITVTRVITGSPAEAAGFQKGDVLVSVNGVKFASNSEEKCLTCEATKENWKPGSKAQYVVSRNGAEIPLTATLAAIPPDVMAQWIGMHMLEHAQPVEVAKK